MTRALLMEDQIKVATVPADEYRLVPDAKLTFSVNTPRPRPRKLRRVSLHLTNKRTSEVDQRPPKLRIGLQRGDSATVDLYITHHDPQLTYACTSISNV